MLNKKEGRIDWLSIQGTPFEVGQALGKKGKDAVHTLLVPSSDWAFITDKRHQKHVERLTKNTQDQFPTIWAELEGLAAGLDLPINDVFAWNCRGDLFALAPDGCTSVQLPGDTPVLGHNEDGYPFLKESCFIAEVAPVGQNEFWAFCYPGSIPGHTFALTQNSLAMTVNNLRLLGVEADLPRMVISRAVLQQSTLQEVLDLIQNNCNSAGFHFSLLDRVTGAFKSVEFGAGQYHCHDLQTPGLHANHALHLDIAQRITDSSGDRQTRGDALLANGCFEALSILQDKQATGLPIYRDTPDDPDNENTLASVIFTLGPDGIDWMIYDQQSTTPVYTRHSPNGKTG
ncbi:C45 family autoproteolytic acyltransferase/hydolase [Terasakiella pusilla]|uniref:C45 family autoproteolytic acyltransferase/hydolase n=1 Tax=Terasakiella pusilla TaxID=64973 RepID=UPI003AA99907